MDGEKETTVQPPAGGAGVDPQRGGAAKKKLDPYLTPKGGQLTPKTR